MKTIVTLTLNPAIDKNSSVESVAAERKLRCEKPVCQPGGGGLNVSRAVKRLGGESLAVYASGGTLGRMLEDLLEAEKINHRPVRIRGMLRENFIVYERSSSQQYRFGMPGPEMSEKEWRACLEAVTGLDPPGFLVASGSLPPGVPDDFYARLVAAFAGTGTRIIVDASGEPLEKAAEAGVFLLKPNLRELEMLSGEALIHERSGIEDAARGLIQGGKTDYVVVSLGAQGALLVGRDDCLRIPAPTAPIKSKVGAGDSMVAGLVLRLAEGARMNDAAAYGVAAGSAAVMTPGTELCRKVDADRLYRDMLGGWPDKKANS